MTFGLKTVPAIFQHGMHVILPPVKGQYVFVYLENNFVFSHSSSEHIAKVRQVLNLGRNAWVDV